MENNGVKIELHILQNFAPSCLNRDDVNAPKDCEFGGFRRARISSQCQKRAVRVYWNQNGFLSENRGLRTRRIVNYVIEILEREGRDAEEAKSLVKFLLSHAGGLAVKEDGTTEYLLFLGDQAVGNLSRAMNEHWDELISLLEVGQEAVSETETRGKRKRKKPAQEQIPTAVQNAVQSLFDGRKAADLAMFGRMVADRPDYNIDAACQVAHAISTHRVNMEVDFFTAVDDLLPQEETGAAHMGPVEFNSACFYRYSMVDHTQLVKNLGGDEELAAQTLKAYVKALVHAVPSGKQTSFAAYNLPHYVMAVVRTQGTPWSLANAFEEPIRPRLHDGGGLAVQSVSRLDKYWGKLKGCYGDDGITYCAALSLPEVSLEHVPVKINTLQELIDGVTAALEVKP